MKRNTLANVLLAIGLLGVSLAGLGCNLVQSAGARPAPAFAETATLAPTETLRPTETPAPTLTPTETHTPSPTPTDTATPLPTVRPSPTFVVETGLEPISALNAGRLTNLAILRFEDSTDSPSRAAFISDGSHVVVISGDPYKTQPPARVKLINTKTGDVVDQFEISADERRAWITSDGLYVMAYQEEGSMLRVYDVFGGALEAEQSIGASFESKTSPGRWVSADGWRVAFQLDQQTLKLWDVRRGVELTTLKTASPIRTRGGNPRLGFSPDGSLFVVALDYSYDVYDVQSGQAVATFETQDLEPDPDFMADKIAFSPDNSLFALTGSSSHDDGALQVWQVQTGQPFFASSKSGGIAVIEDLAFSPDGHWLAWAMGTGNVAGVQVHLFDTTTGQRQTILPGFTALAFSPDGSLLADAQEDGTLLLWNIAGSAEAAALTGHGQQDVQDLQFSADGKRLLSLGRDTVRLWGVPASGAAVARGGINVVEKSFNTGGFTAAVPAAWLAQGATPPRYELALNSDLATLKSCAYTGNHTLYLKQLNVTATVTDLETSQVVAQKAFKGKYSGLACPATHVFSTATVDQVVSTLDRADFEAWLKTAMAPLGFTP